MILYQFPISHYCEKIRWALDYKKIPYKLVNLVPGAHVITAKKLAEKTTVPILQTKEAVIQDSTYILDYLDSMFPDSSLTPKDPDLSLKALEAEEYFDEKIGPHLRRFFYYYILPDSTLAKSLILHGAKQSVNAVYFFLFPIVRALMRKGMNINSKTSEKSKQILDHALSILNTTINTSNSGYLIGDSFSRADLTAASLLAPLCLPPESPFPWPDQKLWPKELILYQESVKNQPFYNWVLWIYKKHRNN